MNDKSQYITFFTFSINNYIFSINDSLTFSNNSSFNANVFILISIDELIIDFILQKIKLFNSINVKQKTFNRYSKFRFAKNFFVNSLINLIIIKKIVFATSKMNDRKNNKLIYEKLWIIYYWTNYDEQQIANRC